MLELASLADMRAVIRKSGDLRRFEPKELAAWQDTVERFGEVQARNMID